MKAANKPRDRRPKYITLARTNWGDYYVLRFHDRRKLVFKKDFSVTHYGSREKALAAAIKLRDKMAPKFGKDLNEHDTRGRYFTKPSDLSATGVVGVADGWPAKGNPRIVVTWTQNMPDGSRKQFKQTRSYDYSDKAAHKAALRWGIKLRKEMERLHYRGPSKRGRGGE